jgi:hypothetical protein
LPEAARSGKPVHLQSLGHTGCAEGTGVISLETFQQIVSSLRCAPIDRRFAPYDDPGARANPRQMICDAQASVILLSTQPRKQLRLRVFDLSFGGISFLHNQVLRNGEQLLLVLPASASRALCGVVCSVVHWRGGPQSTMDKEYVIGTSFVREVAGSAHHPGTRAPDPGALDEALLANASFDSPDKLEPSAEPQ